MSVPRLPLPRPSEPLAARMRPRTLDEYVGQEHIVGPGRLLRRAIEADQLSSLLLHGPPGTGKTTLARVIAGSTRAHFEALNAVLAGVKDIRTAIARASERSTSGGRRTILFVDEVHRFNKAQQDALLPWVENGTVVLVGATTENPYFEVNKALVSRSRIFQLRPLTSADLEAVLRAALADRERGFGDREVRLEPDALAHLVAVANGDARAALNALELAVQTTEPGPDGAIVVPLSVAEESIQQRAVLYDKEGDAHFDTISAFIKSVRGGDPDAALYWLAKMVYAGEEPRYIFRRLIILASEDIGLADPQAVVVVEACARAFDRIGMPEGRFPLAQATLYLATTPKSNSTMALFDAIRSVAHERSGDVPNHLKDTSRDKQGFGHGEGYLYPHAYRDHWVAQQYLPEALRGRTFYKPSDQGWEGRIAPELARRREAQIAAAEEGELTPPERWTAAPVDRRADRWLARAASRSSERLATLRDAVFEAADIQRHHLVLDLRAGTGLLTWEALRRAPEGGVWARVADPAQADALRGLAEALDALVRPEVVVGALELDPRFERIVGRDALVTGDPEALLAEIRSAAAPEARLVLVESLARHTQRLAALVPTDALPQGLHATWAEAEERVYTDDDDPHTRTTEASLVAACAAAGIDAATRPLRTTHELHVTEAMVERWLAERPGSWANRMAVHVDPEDMAAIGRAIRRHLVGRAVRWSATSALLEARL